jgi:hypothetical protein
MGQNAVLLLAYPGACESFSKHWAYRNMGRKEKPMSDEQKQGVKQAAKDFYQAGRITLSMALWAMKNAGYSKEEAASWLGLKHV